MATARATDWAEDGTDEAVTEKIPIQEFTGPDGVKTVIEYRVNEAGQNVRVTRRIKTRVVKERVNHAVAERKRWTKFGAEKGHKSGPDTSTTLLGEVVNLRISIGGAKANQGGASAAAGGAGGGGGGAAGQDGEVDLKTKLKGTKILCRTCKGDHFTSKCPYKDTLGSADAVTPMMEDGSGLKDPALTGSMASGGMPSGSAAASTTTNSRYVAPHMREGGRRAGGGESMYGRSRDQDPTLRVTNLSEEADEDDLRELFRRFGKVTRVYIARDRETNAAKGFAFISFEDKAEAELAMRKLNGHGYANMILHVEMSKPREPL